MQPFSPAEVAEALAALPGWRADGVGRPVAIARDFTFPDFGRAIGFMVAVAARAERLDHHPEWSNVYDKVAVRLTTHAAGGVTGLDVKPGVHRRGRRGLLGPEGRDGD